MILTDKRGILTVQFMLATFISLFIVITFFALTFTFVHISITQYMSYSVARRLSLGGISKDKQLEDAKNYYNTKLRPLFFSPSSYGPGDWFEISQTLGDNDLGFASNCNGVNSIPGSTGSGSHVYEEDLSSQDRCLFYGARIQFQSNVINFRIPGLVKEKTEHKQANVTSFLGREPSQEECEDFFDKKEKELKGAWGVDPWDTMVPKEQKSDNGC